VPPKVNFINGDCMNPENGLPSYPDKFWELAICDPPYGIGLDSIYKHGSTDGTIHDKKEWNDTAPTEKYFIELHRISKHQIIWGCNYYAKYIPAVGRIVHDKELVIEDTKLKYSEADLASCSLQKRITIFRYRWNGNVQGDTINWKNDGPDRRIHPTQKPIALYKWLLTKYAKPGDKILDTHVGSASSIIACLDLGYDVTGYELDADYFKAASKRIADFQAQTKLF
jgi:site-specific DNA-methyltransferase (adenine-specific)